MSPRPPDPPSTRRGDSPSARRGGDASGSDPVVVPLRSGGDRSGLAEARRYTPRGRTVRETAQDRRSGDPFRPALQVLRSDAEDTQRRRPADGPSGETRPPRAGTGEARRARVGKTETPEPRRAEKTGTAGRATTRTGTTRTGTAGGARPGSSGTSRTGAAGSGRAGAAGRAGASRGVPVRTGASRGRTRAGAGRPAAARRRPVRKPARPPGLGEPHRRLRVSTVLVLVLFAVIGIRLVGLQLTDAKAYAARGLRDRLITVAIPAHRGAILDRTGAVLAHSVEARYVYADPGMVDNPAEAADRLFPLLGTAGVTRSELIRKLTPHQRPDGTWSRFEYLARGIDISMGNQITAMNIEGVVVRPDERREVPGHDLAANLIGFTNPDDLSGLVGLEQGYDHTLAGVDGERTFESGLKNEIPSGYHEEKPARPGSSVELTIDRDLQFKAQMVLSESMRRVHASFASAIVLDVHTGEVLAQASYPPFDAVNPGAATRAAWRDAGSGIVVDPGSVAKAITLGAALQENVIRPDSTVTIGPAIDKGDTTYRDTHPFPRGTRITLPGILAYSSNVGTITVAGKLGAQKLYEYQKKFGFGTASGEGMPNEAPGLVQPPANWSGSSAGSIPIGMGVSVTPLQMAAAYAAIANDGRYVAPRLVRSVIAPDGRRTAAPAGASRQVLSPANAAALRRALEAVTTVPGATGLSAAIAGYRVAGKTGTGKYVVDGHYASGEVASFVGMAPADAPRYVAAVFAYTPGGNGGAVAGPAFSEIMSFVLRHYATPPTGTNPPSFRITG